MAKKSASINLIKDQKNDLIERVINWSLGIGRALVIITELIALGAFLWRFGLDQQLVDLHTEIRQKQAIVSAFKKNEDEYRNLQDRLSIASNFSLIGETRIQNYKNILGLAAVGIKLNKISLSDNVITLEANVDSIFALSNFINSLKDNQSVESVSIDKIESKISNAVISAGISITLKSLHNQYANQIK